MTYERKQVDVRVWGRDDFDTTRARQDAVVDAAEQDWEIVDIDESTGHPNPLRPRDPSALRLRERPYRAWAFYDHAPRQQTGVATKNNAEASGGPTG